jgi:hypothetical protein
VKINFYAPKTSSDLCRMKKSLIKSDRLPKMSKDIFTVRLRWSHVLNIVSRKHIENCVSKSRYGTSLEFDRLTIVGLIQGSQTQIYRGPHLQGKSLRGPHYRVRRHLRAAMWTNMSYLIHNLTIFEHFLIFKHQNF